jgi:hypothetical protein
VKKNRKNRQESSGPIKKEQPTNIWTNSLGDVWPKELQKARLPNRQHAPSGEIAANNVSARKDEKNHCVNNPAQPNQATRNSASLRDISRGLPTSGSSRQVDEQISKSGIEESKRSDQDSSPSRRRRLAEKLSRLSSIQPPPSPRRPVPITLGIDLGTSSTKVVWREVDSDRAHPLCFGGRENILDDYLLPTVVAFDGSHLAAGTDTQNFLDANPRAEKFSNFKMCLACVSSEKSECNPERCSLSQWRPLLAKSRSGDPIPSDMAVEAVCALHLGKVISLSKKIVQDKLRSRGVDAPIRWTINMAAPVEHMGEKSVLDAFERVLKAGELMEPIFSEESGPREFYDLLDCYEDARTLSAKRDQDCFVYPEIAAEVASMYLSRSARDGLYAFLDVGAGTLDASIFRLYSGDDGPQLSFYAAAVLRFGAAHLESIASRQLAERATGWFKSIKENRASVGSAEFLLPEEAGVFLENANNWIEERVTRGLQRLLKEAFQKERQARPWQDLQLMIGGGGAKVPIYTEASKAAFSRLAENMAYGLLPVPQDFNLMGLPNQVFHRFAVAYGLSFDVPNLADIHLPAQISELKAEAIRPVRLTREAPTKDVC